MKDLFASYSQSLSLKEIGFDGKNCMRFYNADLSLENTFLHSGTVGAPLKQQVFKFFRDKYGLFSEIKCCNTKIILGTFEVEIFRLNDREFGHYGYDTYEKAESACIDKLIELVKNK